MKQFFALILFVAGIPVFGLAVGGYIRYDYQKQWLSLATEKFGEKSAALTKHGGLSLDAVCQKPDPYTRRMCRNFNHVSLLFDSSFWCLIVGLSLIGGIYLAAKLAGSNRALLVTVFSPGLRLVLLILFGLIIVQGAILVFGLYIGEAYAIRQFHFGYGVIAGVGLGALLGAFAMIKAGFSITKRARSIVIGKMVSEAAEPKLWALVKKVAQDVNAVVPKNIVVGIAPNFYVTSADVLVFPEGKTYKDETLYLSLPLLRLLSREQITTVIGHELGHFKGEDTAFSLRFYPIYAGTGQAIAALSPTASGQGARGWGMLALLPALATLYFFMHRFAEAESTIGRQRELEADKVGASVGSARSLGVALLKIGAVAPAWGSVKQAMINALAEGRMFTNVSEVYANTAKEGVTADIVAQVGTTQMSHPTDSHPTTEVRIAAFGLSVRDLQEEALRFDDADSGASLLENITAVEKEVSDFEHRVLVETGQVAVPGATATSSPA